MIEIERNIFRSYDIRGIYPTELNEKLSDVKALLK